MSRILPVFLLLVSCEPTSDCYKNGFSNITWYEINPDIILPSGIRVDSGGREIDEEELDRRLANIDECLIAVTEETDNTVFFRGLKKQCIIIKVVSPIMSKCSPEWQFIDVLAPPQLCIDKEVIPTEECPCRWRTAIQDDNIVITPPAIYLWEIVRMHTGLDFIWDTPFAKCALL